MKNWKNSSCLRLLLGNSLLIIQNIVFLSKFQRQFGPNGIRPPTCGGPASDYVCCRVSINEHGHTIFVPNPNSGHDHHHAASSHLHPQVAVSGGGNAFRAENSNSNNNNGLSSGLSTFNRGLGQCGRRNAHGINGRVAAGRFAVNDGDTDFGKDFFYFL